MTAIKNLTALLVLSFLASGVLGWFLFQSHSDLEAAQAALESIKAEHADELKAKEAEFQRTLDTQAAQHQKMITALNDEHEKKIDELRKGERQRLATAAKEFENIFEGNKTTLQYIDLLEDKVKAGQNLSKAEVEKLTIITTGLGYLKKQYQKPMQEFQELAAYFEAQASKQIAKPKGGFFKRLFSKDFREAEKEYQRQEGAKEAFEQAQGKFSSTYSRAQKVMGSVNLDADAQIQKLHAFIDDKQQMNAEDLTSFFDKARKALRTHQDVLDFEPDAPPLPAPKPQP
ncbi:hypothetical protein [Prosthecobacter sp.]|uniref:hypothetical protein n=1 Tax=Prosthecobacter sp. TaxID=1965333 RepID=UPI001DDB8C30|nr:hypothetical protein [Prosthecobacter sp.]MCB1277005.1 hypothetical protein [Prosthecobacter sp.]